MEARQGRRGQRVLIILAVSLVLITIAYVLLYFYQPAPTH
jgi:flagellar basal body-associated protein FliL